MHDQNKPIKCRRCKLAAQVVIEDSEPKHVMCPGCGITRDYSEVRRMIGEQATAFAAKKVQDSLKRISSKGRSSGVSFSHRPAQIREPKGDFFIDLKDYRSGEAWRAGAFHSYRSLYQCRYGNSRNGGKPAQEGRLRLPRTTVPHRG